MKIEIGARREDGKKRKCLKKENINKQHSNLHKNLFTGGLNKDTHKNFIANEQYFDAQNLSLVDNNKFLSLQNIKGTTNIDNITSNPDATVLGVHPSRYKIG